MSAVLPQSDPTDASLSLALRRVQPVPDFPRPGVVFQDITPVLMDAEAFGVVVERFAREVRRRRVTHVAGIEARGFILGAAAAREAGAGFVCLRKPGKLPRPVHREKFDLEYGSDILEVHQDGLGSLDRVLIVDDVLATGGTLEAAIGLVGQTGAQLAGACVLMELTALGGRERVQSKLAGTDLVALAAVS